MSSVLITQIANWITAAISAAPKILAAYTAIRNFIMGLFGAGLITKEQQDTLMAHTDAVVEAFIKGEPPPAWTVEPDPA